ncbi:hypothetical protein chiPu_0019266 [Chiloscyllium punctatum]|uniref:Ecto-NOX disulfide-thiol exchanger 1/2 domain-containing protein n=1 Tax=Chiloscyllium punctatum TaxID=137246 RepID=A0A401RR58_CHIPU|nr:hypothetical protein [Chiloscyllium punctatum]
MRRVEIVTLSHSAPNVALAAQARALKEENDSLRWQLDAYRNEVELLKQEQGMFQRMDESHTKEQQLHFQQQAMQGMQQEMNGFTLSVSTQGSQTSEGCPASRPLKSEKEALLVGIISTFLHVHPFGANIEYLWSYLQRLDAKISSGEIEMLLSQLPHMFKQEFTGVGATLEKRWKFCAFEGIKTVSQ